MLLPGKIYCKVCSNFSATSQHKNHRNYNTFYIHERGSCSLASLKSHSWKYCQIVTVFNPHLITHNALVEVLVDLIVVFLRKSQCCSNSFGFMFRCKILRHQPGTPFAKQHLFRDAFLYRRAFLHFSAFSGGCYFEKWMKQFLIFCSKCVMFLITGFRKLIFCMSLLIKKIK